MNAGVTFSHNGFYAQKSWTQNRVFTARSLPVVRPADNKRIFIAILYGAFIIGIINAAEGEFADLGYVAPEGQHPGASGHDFIGGDIVSRFQQNRTRRLDPDYCAYILIAGRRNPFLQGCHDGYYLT